MSLAARLYGEYDSVRPGYGAEALPQQERQRQVAALRRTVRQSARGTVPVFASSSAFIGAQYFAHPAHAHPSVVNTQAMLYA